MSCSLIAAVARNGIIGKAGQLPWSLPADLRRFRTLTMGHHLLLGRRTFESIGRPLPGRKTVILSRRLQEAPAGTQLARSLEHALSLAAADEEIFVGGGGEVYQAALPHANRLYLTRVDATVAGDTRFPPLDAHQWRLVARQDCTQAGGSPLSFCFLIYERLA